MEYNEEQAGVLKRYTDDIDGVEIITRHDYETASIKKVSQLMDDYHIIWFHDDPGNYHLIKK